jgi:siroheme synthase (precorrin-2 oxidase/ferrochelatase)
LRDEIEQALDPGLGDWLEDVGALRREILARYPPSQERKQLLQRLAYRQVGELLERETEASESDGTSGAPGERFSEKAAVPR